MNLSLIFNSGKTARPISYEIDLKPEFNIMLNSTYKFIELIGLHETIPSFGKGQLMIKYKNQRAPKLIDLLISQLVVDKLMSTDETYNVNLKVQSFDPPRSAIVLITDIGLSFPNPNASTEKLLECDNCLNHVCQNEFTDCQSQPLQIECEICEKATKESICKECYLTLESEIESQSFNKDQSHNCSKCTSANNQLPDEFQDRNSYGDLLIAIVCSYYTRASSTPVFTKTLKDILPHWSKRLSELKPSEANPTEAWKQVDSIQSNSGTELAYAMFKCHDTKEQSEIVNLKHQRCLLLSECPLINLELTRVNEEILSMSLSNYMTETIQNYFLKTYFFSNPSKLGISILARMRFDQDLKLRDHPLNLLNYKLHSFQSQSPIVTRPSFEKREHKGSTISSITKSDQKRRK